MPCPPLPSLRPRGLRGARPPRPAPARAPPHAGRAEPSGVEPNRARPPPPDRGHRGVPARPEQPPPAPARPTYPGPRRQQRQQQQRGQAEQAARRLHGCHPGLGGPGSPARRSVSGAPRAAGRGCRPRVTRQVRPGTPPPRAGSAAGTGGGGGAAPTPPPRLCGAPGPPRSCESRQNQPARGGDKSP